MRQVTTRLLLVLGLLFLMTVMHGCGDGDDDDEDENFAPLLSTPAPQFPTVDMSFPTWPTFPTDPFPTLPPAPRPPGCVCFTSPCPC
jgi:hypothetical protein